MIVKEQVNTLEDFIRECRALVGELLPQVRQLFAEPAQDIVLGAVTGTGQRLFWLIRTTGAGLGLGQLTAPVEAMEMLLEMVRSNRLLFGPRHISLLLEVCLFIEQGVELIVRERSDQRLSTVAAALQHAVFEAIRDGAGDADGTIPFAGTTPELCVALARENEQLLVMVEQEFVLWDFVAIDHQRIGELCRVLHQLQQNFALDDCPIFERLCMALASTLQRYLQGEFFQTEYPERVFLRCIDAMRASFSRHGLAGKPVFDDAEEHLAAVQGLIRQPLGVLLVQAGLVDSEAVDAALLVQQSGGGESQRRLGEILVAMGEVSEQQIQQVLNEQQQRQTLCAQGMAQLPQASPFSSQKGEEPAG